MGPMRCGERRASWAAWRLGLTLLVMLGTGWHVRSEEVAGQVLVRMRHIAGAGARLQGQGGGIPAVGLQVPAGARIVKPLALPGWHLVELPPACPAGRPIRWFRGHP